MIFKCIKRLLLLYTVVRRKVSTFAGYIACRIHGVSIGRNCRFFGLPWIENHGQIGSVRIGDNLRACSEIGYNSIGVDQRVIIKNNGGRILIGDNVGMSGCTISASREIIIGDRVLIGAGAWITDSDHHPLNCVDRCNKLPGRNASVAIGDDVFIGARAIILKGVRIGNGAVIGAGAVVVKDIASMTVVAGNPAQKIGDVR